MSKRKYNETQNLKFNTNVGQHILKNPLIIKTMVERAAIRKTDTVLEIGPGTGNLTAQLLEKCAKLILFEIDSRMVAELHKRFQKHPNYKNIKIVQADAVKEPLPHFDVCVANLPYQISSPIVFKLLSHRPFFRHAVLMFQREFAQRLVANPSDKVYCRLSVNTQLLSRVSILLKVGKNNFRPPPKVESSIVRIEPIKPAPVINYKEFDIMLRICFNRKNKLITSAFKNSKVLEMIDHNLKIHHNFNKELIQDEENKIIPADKLVPTILNCDEYKNARSRTTTIDSFLRLLSLFNEQGIHFA